MRRASAVNIDQTRVERWLLDKHRRPLFLLRLIPPRLGMIYKSRAHVAISRVKYLRKEVSGKSFKR